MNGDELMEAKLRKWGNSDGIRIPSNILKELNIKTNDVVNIYEEDEKIIIAKPKNEPWTIEEGISEYNKLPEHEKGNIEPYDWGEDVGNEKWY